MTQLHLVRNFALAWLFCYSAAWAESIDAKRYIEVRTEYEQYRCQQVKLMRAQGDAANANDMDKARGFYEERIKLMGSAEVQQLEGKLRELREQLMMVHSQDDYDAILAAEGEIRNGCR